MPGLLWAHAPATAALSGRDVHVWCARLDRSPRSQAALQRLLSADERQRAGRFHFERDRRRYTCARGVLRSLLGEYLGAKPETIAFSYGAHGKPALDGLPNSTLMFNVSHSDELALFAFSRGIELGVDVEAVRPVSDAEQIATSFFSPREVARLLSLPLALRQEAFFACWTMKEAYLKALGSGLAKPLDAFDVSFGPDEVPRLAVLGDEEETRRWRLQALAPATGYKAALVTEGPTTAVRCLAWTDARAFEEPRPPVLTKGAAV
jgi:4'-phosphopantetheinyl transferase